MLVGFTELKEKFFNVSDIFVSKQCSEKKTSIDMCAEPRPTDALLFFKSGNAVCYQQGSEPYFVSQGSLMYMPKGSRYIWDTLPSVATGKNERILFEFNLYESTINRNFKVKKVISSSQTDERLYFADHVIQVGSNHSSAYNVLFEKLLDKFQKDTENTLELYLTIYEIFSFISNDCVDDKRKGDFSVIEKGIDYLENDNTFKLNINELAEMCNVSMRYFEKLFKEYSGVNPKEYMEARRVYAAKILLCEKSVSLEEIAGRLSFCDSGHLCRFFKQKTGLTPTEYKNLYL